jgi:hypothetical protein
MALHTLSPLTGKPAFSADFFRIFYREVLLAAWTIGKR